MRPFGTAAILLGALRVASAHDGYAANPLTGVAGFPSCERAHPLLQLSEQDAAMDLVCSQRTTSPSALKIGTIGDSITAGVCSSGGNHTYPGQLQIMLDSKYGEGHYDVTNLGACGSTMQRAADSPYWERPQFSTLKSNKWDIIVIMLGTNDAKDPGSKGPNNWLHNCGGPEGTTLSGCTFAADYADMIALVRTLGTSDAGPTIFTAIPPPLMQLDSIGANQTVINSVYPKLVPMINAANKISQAPINVFSAMGGNATWQDYFPGSCSIEAAKTYAPCGLWCDSQSCDQCHPDDNGYVLMAKTVMAGLGL